MHSSIYIRYPIPKSPPSLRAARNKSPLDYLYSAHDLGKGTFYRHFVAQII